MPTIAIIAPSSYAPDQVQVQRAIVRLQERGWMVKNLVEPTDKFLRFSADDATRLAQLYVAADDPEVDVILALRGGYGFSRLLEQVDFSRLAASGKLFVGFSDFTPLHLGLLAKTGQISFAGPMLYEDFGPEQVHEFSFDYFNRCLLSAEPFRIHVATADNPNLQLQGTFWGGNLTMLCHLVGSEFMPLITGGILFVEDVNENPYRVERMLIQLHHAGILAQQKALILGHFTNYKSSDYDNGYDFAAMLDFIRNRIGIPVITGLPFGHCANKLTLPIGAQVELVSNVDGFSLAFGDYPHLVSY